MTVRITPEMITAWRMLQNYAAKLPRYVNPTTEEKALAEAINVLDNSNWMVPIQDAAADDDDNAPHVLVVIEKNGPLFQARGVDNRLWSTATTYGKVEENLAEREERFLIVSPEEMRVAKLHPAEWGDTTREDMARHQRETATLAAEGEGHLTRIPLSELTGEGLSKALRKGKDSTN